MTKSEEQIGKLSDLYEEGKDKCYNLLPGLKHDDHQDVLRLLEILVEMRDIAAISLQLNNEVEIGSLKRGLS